MPFGETNCVNNARLRRSYGPKTVQMWTMCTMFCGRVPLPLKMRGELLGKRACSSVWCAGSFALLVECHRRSPSAPVSYARTHARKHARTHSTHLGPAGDSLGRNAFIAGMQAEHIKQFAAGQSFNGSKPGNVRPSIIVTVWPRMTGIEPSSDRRGSL